MSHVFEPEQLHALVRPLIGQRLPDIFEAVVDGLAARYPGHILRDESGSSTTPAARWG